MANKNVSGGAGTGRKVVEAVKPWSREATWWVLAIEAVIAIGLGIYVLTQPGSTAGALIYALGIFLVVDGLIAGFNALRGVGGKTFGAMRAGVSLLGGVIVLLIPLIDPGNLVLAGWVLGIVLVASGLFGLLATFFERGGRRLRWINVLITALMIVLGLGYIYSLAAKDPAILIWLGWLLVAVGVMLGIYAAFVWSQGRQARVGSGG